MCELLSWMGRESMRKLLSKKKRREHDKHANTKERNRTKRVKVKMLEVITGDAMILARMR